MDTMNEEEAHMMAFLEHLKSQDPALYTQTIAAMQQQMAAAVGSSPELGSGSGDGTGSSPLDNLSGMIDALKSAKGEEGKGEGALVDGINMPGMAKLMGKGGVEDKKPGIMIMPEPGFVVKTKEIPSDQKVMINMCIHEEIEKPSLKKKLDENGEPVEGMNVPLSVGASRNGTDKSGVACVIYDVIVNPEVLKESNEDETGRYRDFICQLCIQAIESKYKLNLDKRYKLPKLKVMGELQSQYIQDRKRMPKIEEVRESEKATETSRAKKTDTKKKGSVTPENPPEPAKLIDLPYSVSWYNFQRTHMVATDFIASDPSEVIEECSSSEYVEPTKPVPEGRNAVRVLAEVTECSDFKKLDVQMSAYKIKIAVPGHNPLTINFPCTLLPAKSMSRMSRPEGSLRRVVLCIIAQVDTTPLCDMGVDPGSKQWLLAKALDADERAGGQVDTSNPYREAGYVARSPSLSSSSTAAASAVDDDELPEDKFHIRMPKNVDKYTGLPTNSSADDGRVDESEELPEDRFHRKDAQSSYIIEQREQAIKEKWDRAAKEKEERKNDPNIEYVDVDDYKPGGKYGPPAIVSEASYISAAVADDKDAVDRLKAATAVRSVVAEKMDAAVQLSSTLWSELLE